MRYKYIINGIVQGVGFRPTVYKIATSLNLKGYVLNSSDGVIIEIEGKNRDKFLNELKNNLPPLAKIEKIECFKLPLKNYKDFEIKYSINTTKTTSISPDISVCEDCLKEMRDKNNRRYLYPFINCTNCGPRYTIIENIPYDRVNTSMKKFKMCENCKKEYENPIERRFHAEPISCYECGPKLSVKFKIENGKWAVKDFNREIKKIEFIANKIKEGKIVAIKGLGGFHLVCDATNEKSVYELRKRKNRPLKPFAMMFRDIEMIKKYADISNKEKELILSKERPIVIVKKKKELKGIADKIDRYGVFLPYTPIHYLLFDFLDFPIVATSANISDEPIIRNSKELIEKLGSVVDFILDNNRDIINACDDSVVQVVNEERLFMRLSRGFAPKSFYIDKKTSPNILALGANQKNTISLYFNQKVILSPHIGDLKTLGSIEFFERTINTFRRLYEFKEDVIICDKHPYYESTKWALSQNKEVIQIQHHFSHALSVMFENSLDGEFLAFLFDGTGYGDDGSIWGGEVFRVTKHNYERIHYIKPFKLIGSEKGVKNPSNYAISLIDEQLAKNFKNYEIIKKLQNGPFPLTSSMGRVFDAVAFLSGMIDRNEYEGISGLIIEKFYNENIKGFIDIGIKKELDFKEIFNFAYLNRGKFELVSSIFINSLVNLVVKLSKYYNLPVILSGGVFQNKTLLGKILKNIYAYYNKEIPINDGGISIGQVAYGIWNLRRENGT
ncbi:carbamoyltransferase HypF [Caminibacter mediatlanticus]|uniref:Carbamoyltransferase n=1 Tax=Caminibacter mediatlanticus TB-2 TaxID=391592 RepID=A0AAI9AIC3_9BACT|nr:carbamoyltransferase HypF [Caminibacter mediatlanticus]EDM24044.1 transcriptional regulatory protein HypF [Caminibacter mediatlanticus TB-2]